MDQVVKMMTYRKEFKEGVRRHGYSTFKKKRVLFCLAIQVEEEHTVDKKCYEH